MAIYDYQNDLTISKTYFQAAFSNMIVKETPLEVELSLSKPEKLSYSPLTDYSAMIHYTTNSLLTIEENLKIHNYLKLSQEQADSILAGKKTDRVVSTVKYKVTSWDTPQSIAKKFNIAWQDIADYNNLSSTAFVQGIDIIIPIVNQDTNKSTQYINNPVFESHIGERALGRDCENTLTSSDNDLKINSYVDTFAQGITNILSTEPGEILSNFSYGLDLVVGEDVPEDARKQLYEMKIRNCLAGETRIESVLSVTVDKKENSYNIKTLVKPINDLEAVLFSDYIDRSII